MCLPTGAGKTVTFVDIIVDCIKKGLIAMIICDRKELINQALERVQDLGLNPTIIAPKHRQYKNNVYLASVDTLRRREIPKVDIVIVDEAHKQSFDSTIKRIIEEFDPFLIGATATPKRTGSQNCLSEIYQSVIEPIKLSELIDQNFLVPARTFAAREDFTNVKKRGMDFDAGEMYKEFNKPQLYDGVIDNYIKFGNRKKAICFNVNVEHSKNTCEKFNERGIPAKHIDGTTPESERKEILKDFHLGKFTVLCNCSVLTTGFDEPSIECVIVNRATLSLPLWLQMCGRGSRLYNNKKEFIILDHGANVYRHGLWEEDRKWSLHKKKHKGDGVAPVKMCEACEEINFASARVCKTCGKQFPVKKKTLKEAEFVEVKSKRGLNSTPDIKKMNQKELHQFAKEQGYKPGWVHHQIKLRKRI